MLVDECLDSRDVHGGIICDARVQVRRIAFNSISGSGSFMFENIFILKFDDKLTKDVNMTEYLGTEAYTVYGMRDLGDPMNHWTIPFATGHKYRVHFKGEIQNF